MTSIISEYDPVHFKLKRTGRYLSKIIYENKIYFFTLLLIAALILISLQIFQSSYGPHGGAIKPTGNYNIEMKNSAGSIYSYLLEQNLKPISNRGITCEASLVFPDYSRTDIELKPFGEDGFSSDVITKYFASSTITFHVLGKNISSEFESETLFAKKK